jgi:hypothetical protein
MILKLRLVLMIHISPLERDRQAQSTNDFRNVSLDTETGLPTTIVQRRIGV